MSGPIVRRYGFPNHEEIFGKRPMEHGAEESDSKAEAEKTDESAKAKKDAPADPKPSDDPKS